MDDPHALPHEIQQALEHGWTVLTANQRAARTLRHAFDLRQRILNRTNWEPPPILAWDTWLSSLWYRLLIEGHASELLLNPTQEHTIWRAIITADAATRSLRPVDSLAETAADAWLLLHSYRGRNRLRDCPGNSDTQVFTRWANSFERFCGREQYLTQAQLPEAIRTAIIARKTSVPPGILLVGFDSRKAAQTALLEAVRTLDTPIEEMESAPPAPDITLVDAPSEYDELTACARWLRTRLTEQPDSSLAVIVPALETCRAEIDRVFRHILAPELDDINASAGSGPYEFSLGIPLARTPLVAAALDILRWTIDPLSVDRVSALLLSPHFAADGPSNSELLSRSEFDAFVLRDQHLLQPQLSLEALNALVSHPKRSLPVLLNHLRTMRPLFNRRDLATGQRSHADWTATIHELLAAAGWAIPAHLDSTEFQTRRKWESALDELATLDFGSGRVSFADALTALERITTETLFAPESRHAPIQVMGPLESAGSTFDAIWFLRANDIAWPANPAPNPLLPWQLQRDLGMPGVTPALDSAHARRITERIAASAPTVLFSYARESADGPQRSSPVLAGLALEPRSASVVAPPEPAPQSVEIETIEDDIPIPHPPDHALQGGAAILQSQAACGFRAFAERRLFSSALNTTDLGLDPLERGSLVHKVLEKFWAKVQTQAALKNMPHDERHAELTRAIDAAFAEFPAVIESGWPRAYVSAERQRLLNLLLPWLRYESDERPDFIVKSREETLREVSIGPLHISIRVDRIDTALVDGEPAGEIILDYKTGLSKPSDWLGDRPEAPQLPLYAVVSGLPNLAAVAFASIRPGGDMGLKGYQARDGVLLKPTKLKTESLRAQVDKWRGVLTSLAEDFHSGDASVSPKRYPQTCNFCKQRLLCRLDPSALDADILDDSDADSDQPNSSGTEADRG
jgi:ATP-dependent helicase/nuclease subunit B